MATHITISAESRSYTMVLSTTDIMLAGTFADAQYYIAFAQCMYEENVVARQSLLDATRSLLEAVRQQWAVLPYRYSSEVRIMGRDDLVSKGGGGCSGFHINGRIHSLWSRAGECYLEEMEVGPDGRGGIVRRIDIRDRKQVDTDDWGPIKLSRRKLKTALPEQLQVLISFLGEIPDAQVQTRRSEGQASVMDLVRRTAEGDESAEEEFFNRGDAARQELLAKLTDRKTRKYCGTMAWILLTVLPSPESRAAVEELAERETDPQQKAEYVLLLASTPSR